MIKKKEHRYPPVLFLTPPKSAHADSAKKTMAPWTRKGSNVTVTDDANLPGTGASTRPWLMYVLGPNYGLW